MTALHPPASDESSILRDVRDGLIDCDTAVEMLQELGYEYSEACDGVANAMALLEHRQ